MFLVSLFVVSIFTHIGIRKSYEVIDAKRYLAWYRDCLYVQSFSYQIYFNSVRT